MHIQFKCSKHKSFKQYVLNIPVCPNSLKTVIGVLIRLDVHYQCDVSIYTNCAASVGRSNHCFQAVNNLQELGNYTEYWIL